MDQRYWFGKPAEREYIGGRDYESNINPILDHT